MGLIGFASRERFRITFRRIPSLTRYPTPMFCWIFSFHKGNSCQIAPAKDHTIEYRPSPLILATIVLQGQRTDRFICTRKFCPKAIRNLRRIDCDPGQTRHHFFLCVLSTLGSCRHKCPARSETQLWAGFSAASSPASFSVKKPMKVELLGDPWFNDGQQLFSVSAE